jgi:hypothetical protein
MDLHLIGLPRKVRNEHCCVDDGQLDHIFHEFLVMDRSVNLFLFKNIKRVAQSGLESNLRNNSTRIHQRLFGARSAFAGFPKTPSFKSLP